VSWPRRPRPADRGRHRQWSEAPASPMAISVPVKGGRNAQSAVKEIGHHDEAAVGVVAQPHPRPRIDRSRLGQWGPHRRRIMAAGAHVEHGEHHRSADGGTCRIRRWPSVAPVEIGVHALAAACVEDVSRDHPRLLPTSGRRQRGRRRRTWRIGSRFACGWPVSSPHPRHYRGEHG
jgi:hypothetical protein